MMVLYYTDSNRFSSGNLSHAPLKLIDKDETCFCYIVLYCDAIRPNLMMLPWSKSSKKLI